MISIIMPVYNGEKYLKDSIESIQTQTYTNFELIVVNDCSTDNTKDIVESYAKNDSRIKIVNNVSNQKLPRSLNIGFEHAGGEYITWTSDDNLMYPNMLEELMNELICKPDVALVFSRYEFIDDEGKIFGQSPIYGDLDEIYCNNIVGASFLYKREVHMALNGYADDKFLIEDYDFWMRAYRQFEFSYVPKILYSYRMHKNNLGTKRMEEIRLKKIELIKENLPYVNDDVKNRIYREIANCYYDASNVYYDFVRKEAATKYCKIILKYRLKDIIKKMINKK